MERSARNRSKPEGIHLGRTPGRKTHLYRRTLLLKLHLRPLVLRKLLKFDGNLMSTLLRFDGYLSWFLGRLCLRSYSLKDFVESSVHFTFYGFKSGLVILLCLFDEFGDFFIYCILSQKLGYIGACNFAGFGI
jgi:hypothetical protein